MHHRRFALTALLVACQLLIAVPRAMAADGVPAQPMPPYPPGCVPGRLYELDLAGPAAVRFFSGRVPVEVASDLGQARLELYRVACAEPGRSLIVAEFSEVPGVMALPWLGGSSGFDPPPFEFRNEGNFDGPPLEQFLLTRRTIGDYTNGWYDISGGRWRFLLDLRQPWDAAPEYYNGAFTLELFGRRNQVDWLLFSVDVPSTAALFDRPARMPLSGRLSGHWVEAGAADQGLLIAFNLLTQPVPMGGYAAVGAPLHVFLSWFTFDRAGRMLWLTGAQEFAQGAETVTLAIEAVDQGVFLGDAAARRETVGTARLRAVSCDHLELRYDLRELGLGADTLRLQRIFALEIDGFPCRDSDALQASLIPASSP